MLPGVAKAARSLQAKSCLVSAVLGRAKGFWPIIVTESS